MMGKENSPWRNAEVYKFFEIEIAIIKGKPTDPVRYYTELHKFGRYFSSRGSNAPTKFIAVLIHLFKELGKE